MSTFLQWAVLSVPFLVGAVVCYRFPLRKGPLLGQGRGQAWGGEERGGLVCRKCCFPCLCLGGLLWLLFMWVFITSGLVADTQLHTRAHLAPHLDTLTDGLSVWGEEASVPRCEVCTDRLGGGVSVGAQDPLE